MMSGGKGYIQPKTSEVSETSEVWQPPTPIYKSHEKGKRDIISPCIFPNCSFFVIFI